MVSYHPVFDVATAGFREWRFVGIGFLLTAVGAALVFAPGLMQRIMPGGLQGGARGCFSWFYFLFALTWTAIAGTTLFSRHLDLRNASMRGECTIVEGVVENFAPMPYGGHAMESFTVDGVRFEYSDYVINGGFNNTQSHGGPIYEGQRVRVCYMSRATPDGDVIVRLEIAD